MVTEKIWNVAKVNGPLVSAMPAVEMEKLLYRKLEQQKFQHSRGGKQIWFGGLITLQCDR